MFAFKGLKGSAVDDSSGDFDPGKVEGQYLVFSGIISAAARKKVPELVALHAWHRYCAVLQVFNIFGTLNCAFRYLGLEHHSRGRESGIY
jgi:hypothetical protein